MPKRPGTGFRPDVLTIGFARRIASYKRIHLLGADPGRALALLAGDRPVQLLLAGKAHPQDDEAKRTVQDLFQLKGAPEVGGRVVFLEDYDLALARPARGRLRRVGQPAPAAARGQRDQRHEGGPQRRSST